jgi:predicted lysophospholipase L1 biosynthesis ABC-type transport system permease subunit
MLRRRHAGTLTVPFAVAVVAIGCCAALPLLAGAFAGVALATALGVGGGVLALIAAVVTTALIMRARRRRSCPPPDERPAS